MPSPPLDLFVEVGDGVAVGEDVAVSILLATAVSEAVGEADRDTLVLLPDGDTLVLLPDGVEVDFEV